MANELTATPSPFMEDLKSLINKYSIEDGSDTPDHILAMYLNGCLMVFEIAVKARDNWHGVDVWQASRLK